MPILNNKKEQPYELDKLHFSYIWHYAVILK